MPQSTSAAPATDAPAPSGPTRKRATKAAAAAPIEPSVSIVKSHRGCTLLYPGTIAIETIMMRASVPPLAEGVIAARSHHSTDATEVSVGVFNDRLRKILLVLSSKKPEK